MKVFILLISGVLIHFSLFSQGKGTTVSNDPELYRELNNNERRLMEFKDSDEALKLKLTQLDVINKS
jgi:hypothetical protein